MMLRRSSTPKNKSRTTSRLPIVASVIFLVNVSTPLVPPLSTSYLSVFSGIPDLLDNTKGANQLACTCSGSKPTCPDGKTAFCAPPLIKNGVPQGDCYWACPCKHERE